MTGAELVYCLIGAAFLYTLIGGFCSLWHDGEEGFHFAQAALWPIYLPLVWLPRGLVRMLRELRSSWVHLARELDRDHTDPKDPEL